MAQARAWIAANPKASSPGTAEVPLPGGDSRSPAVAQMLAIAPSVAAAKSWGNYPAVSTS
jgi:3-hydroxyacyl-CoA dehydrogenase/enoyl-CoA hydratase/3-hydroxybutyryl-CoA epimerase